MSNYRIVPGMLTLELSPAINHKDAAGNVIGAQCLPFGKDGARWVAAIVAALWGAHYAITGIKVEVWKRGNPRVFVDCVMPDPEKRPVDWMRLQSDLEQLATEALEREVQREYAEAVSA